MDLAIKPPTYRGTPGVAEQVADSRIASLVSVPNDRCYDSRRMKSSDPISPAVLPRASFAPAQVQALGVHPGRAPHASLRPESFDFLQPLVAPLIFPGAAEVFDFTQGYDSARTLRVPYGLGVFAEDRRGMYETALFQGAEPRTIHVGLDMAAPEGTPVFSPYSGEIHGAAILSADGDYGGTVIVRSRPSVEGERLYSLLGHLSHRSAKRWRTGDRVAAGELLGWLGSAKENGGWNPHLHWQLTWLEPTHIDLPGAVAARHRDEALQVFLNPELYLASAIAGWTRGRASG